MNILKETSLFQTIDDKDCKQLINCLLPQVKHFSKNEIILMAGYPISHIGIILSGNARAYSEHMDGSQTIMSNLSPSSIFGDTLVSTKTHKSPVTIYSTNSTTVAFIEYDKILTTCAVNCDTHRIFLQNMFKSIGDKYFMLFDRINILREKTLRLQIKAFLHKLSINGELTEVYLPFTKTMLADYLLANRSAVSKELGKMQRDGVIEVNGRNIRIVNML